LNASNRWRPACDTSTCQSQNRSSSPRDSTAAGSSVAISDIQRLVSSTEFTT
jgi:hypothetical protein